MTCVQELTVVTIGLPPVLHHPRLRLHYVRKRFTTKTLRHRDDCQLWTAYFLLGVLVSLW
jgi:hypothetical protein